LVAGVALIVFIVVPLGLVHERLSLATPALLLVLPVLISAVLGGRRSSIVIAVCAALAFNVIFIPPVLTLQIRDVEDVIAYVIFVTVAVVVGTLVSRESARRRTAELNEAEMTRVHAALVEATTERERLAAEAQRVSVLEAVHRQRAALLRSVSHDLRTPLVTIRGVSSELRSGNVFDDATREDLLDLVISEAERLDRLVANLLSLSRIEADALEPHLDSVDLDEVVASCAHRLRHLFAGTSLEIALDHDLPMLLADPGLLDQVLTNLLENAVQHGSHHICLSARTIREGGYSPFVRVTVSDDGPGLGAVDRDRLFEPWNALGQSSLSGVGLAICKAIVQAHGGTIIADDNPSGGARFTFTLPVFGVHDDTA
jgi:two-component system sensor histidine kinase KdpD